MTASGGIGLTDEQLRMLGEYPPLAAPPAPSIAPGLPVITLRPAPLEVEVERLHTYTPVRRFNPHRPARASEPKPYSSGNLTKAQAKQIMANMHKTLFEDEDSLTFAMDRLSIKERKPPAHGDAQVLPFEPENPGIFGKIYNKAMGILGMGPPKEEPKAPLYPNALSELKLVIHHFRKIAFNPDKLFKDPKTYQALCDFAYSTASEPYYDASKASKDYLNHFKPLFRSESREIAYEKVFQDMYKSAFERIRGIKLPANIY